MQRFGSWWERVPIRQIGTALAVVAVVAMLGFQAAPSQAGAGSGSLLRAISGEVWG
jgi:hypothetical protein